MADKYWQGNEGNYVANQTHVGESNWDDDGAAYATSNWRLCSDGSGCAKPVAADDLWFDNRAYYNSIDERYQDLDTGLTGDPDVASIHVGNTFDGMCGGSGDYLDINVQSGDGELIFEGTGSFFLRITKGAAADSGIDSLIVNSSDGFLYLKSEVNNATYVCEITKAVCYDGTLNVAIEQDADTIYLNKLVVVGTGAIVNIGTSVQRLKAATAEMNIQQIAGTITSDSPINSYEGYAGTMNWGTADATAKADVDALLVTLFGTVVFNWMVKHSGTAQINKIVAYGGTLDASLVTNANVVKQIGSGAAEISELHTGAIMNLNNGNGNIALEATSKIHIYGGTFYPPYGAEISW